MTRIESQVLRCRCCGSIMNDAAPEVRESTDVVCLVDGCPLKGMIFELDSYHRRDLRHLLVTATGFAPLPVPEDAVKLLDAEWRVLEAVYATGYELSQRHPTNSAYGHLVALKFLTESWNMYNRGLYCYNVTDAGVSALRKHYGG